MILSLAWQYTWQNTRQCLSGACCLRKKTHLMKRVSSPDARKMHSEHHPRKGEHSPRLQQKDNEHISSSASRASFSNLVPRQSQAHTDERRSSLLDGDNLLASIPPAISTSIVQQEEPVERKLANLLTSDPKVPQEGACPFIPSIFDLAASVNTLGASCAQSVNADHVQESQPIHSERVIDFVASSTHSFESAYPEDGVLFVDSSHTLVNNRASIANLQRTQSEFDQRLIEFTCDTVYARRVQKRVLSVWRNLATISQFIKRPLVRMLRAWHLYTIDQKCMVLAMRRYRTRILQKGFYALLSRARDAVSTKTLLRLYMHHIRTVLRIYLSHNEIAHRFYTFRLQFRYLHAMFRLLSIRYSRCLVFIARRDTVTKNRVFILMRHRMLVSRNVQLFVDQSLLRKALHCVRRGAIVSRAKAFRRRYLLSQSFISLAVRAQTLQITAYKVVQRSCVLSMILPSEFLLGGGSFSISLLRELAQEGFRCSSSRSERGTHLFGHEHSALPELTDRTTLLSIHASHHDSRRDTYRAIHQEYINVMFENLCGQVASTGQVPPKILSARAFYTLLFSHKLREHILCLHSQAKAHAKTMVLRTVFTVMQRSFVAATHRRTALQAARKALGHSRMRRCFALWKEFVGNSVSFKRRYRFLESDCNRRLTSAAFDAWQSLCARQEPLHRKERLVSDRFLRRAAVRCFHFWLQKAENMRMYTQIADNYYTDITQQRLLRDSLSSWHRAYTVRIDAFDCAEVCLAAIFRATSFGSAVPGGWFTKSYIGSLERRAFTALRESLSVYIQYKANHALAVQYHTRNLIEQSVGSLQKAVSVACAQRRADSTLLSRVFQGFHEIGDRFRELQSVVAECEHRRTNGSRKRVLTLLYSRYKQLQHMTVLGEPLRRRQARGLLMQAFKALCSVLAKVEAANEKEDECRAASDNSLCIRALKCMVWVVINRRIKLLRDHGLETPLVVDLTAQEHTTIKTSLEDLILVLRNTSATRPHKSLFAGARDDCFVNTADSMRYDISRVTSGSVVQHAPSLFRRYMQQDPTLQQDNVGNSDVRQRRAHSQISTTWACQSLSLHGSCSTERPSAASNDDVQGSICTGNTSETMRTQEARILHIVLPEIDARIDHLSERLAKFRSHSRQVGVIPSANPISSFKC